MTTTKTLDDFVHEGNNCISSCPTHKMCVYENNARNLTLDLVLRIDQLKGFFLVSYLFDNHSVFKQKEPEDVAELEKLRD